MTDQRVNLHKDLILEGNPFEFFFHFRSQKSQEGLKIANPVTRTLITWTAQTTNRLFPLLPLCENESACETIHM